MHCVQINAACIIDEASVLDSGRKDALCLCILYPLMYLGWHKQSWNPELPISRAVGMLSAAVGWLWCKGGLTSFSGELFIFRVVYGSLCPSLQVKRWSLKTTKKKQQNVSHGLTILLSHDVHFRAWTSFAQDLDRIINTSRQLRVCISSALRNPATSEESHAVQNVPSSKLLQHRVREVHARTQTSRGQTSLPSDNSWS